MSQEYPFKGIPLTTSVARHHVPILLQDGKPHKRVDIIRRMEEAHAEQGGVPGNGLAPFKKAIVTLMDGGRVVKRMDGFYQISLDSGTADRENETPPQIAEPTTDVTDNSVCGPARIVGSGAESVYVYYNENDERLARLEGRDFWDCKVGFTAGNVTTRILGQGPQTSMARLPKVGLIIKTDDAKGLERTLHFALDDAGARIEEAPGNEWFTTSPERIAAWWEAYSKSVEVLRFVR